MYKNRTTVMRVAHLDMAKRGMFNPKNKTNTESNARKLDVASLGMPQMKKERINTRKSTWKNLSKLGYCRSWENSTKENNIKTRGCHATNDQSEITTGGTTQGIELGGIINISRAAAQSDARRNGFGIGQYLQG